MLWYGNCIITKIFFALGILLSLNSQCKMGIEDLSIQDDPKSKKKYIFLSKFVSSVKGDHDFALKLTLNVLANAVVASRTNQDDISKEMLTFIKSQLEFMRIQYKAAQNAEREAGKLAISFRDNINRITRQMSDWETPKRSKQIVAVFQDAVNISPSKRNVPFTPPQNQSKDLPTYGILAQPLSRPGSPWEKRNMLNGDPASPRTPTINSKRGMPSSEKRENPGTPEKNLKLCSSNYESTRYTNMSGGIGLCHTNSNSKGGVATVLAKNECDPKPKVDAHGFLNFPLATSCNKSNSNENHGLPESQIILPDDTDDIFKTIQF